MSKLRLIGGGLLASAACLAIMRRRRSGGRRRLHENGEGLHRPGVRRRSRNGTARPRVRRRRARSWSSTSRPISATAARRASATARRKPPRRSAGSSASSTGRARFPARTSALTQAIALKPDGIILGSPTRSSRRRMIEQAVAAGIKVVGWHSGPGPGKIEADPDVFTNITTDPERSRQGFGPLRGGRLGGTAGVILFTDSIYAIATAKTNAEKAAVEGCKGCKVLSIEDTPIGDLANRMGQLTTSLLSKYGKAWTYSIGVNDLYFDFSAPSLNSAGVDPAVGLSPQYRGGRRFGAGLPAHSRQAISDRHGRRAAASAWLAVHRRNEPRASPASRRAASSRTSICSSTPTSTRTAARRTSSIPATTTRIITRRSGA